MHWDLLQNEDKKREKDGVCKGIIIMTDNEI